ncbi:MAG: hypothetical protein Q7R85_04175 [bacterium]|nr:hypothetical protein [bacterium]
MAVTAPSAAVVFHADVDAPIDAIATDGAEAEGDGKTETEHDALHGVLLSKKPIEAPIYYSTSMRKMKSAWFIQFVSRH